MPINLPFFQENFKLLKINNNGVPRWLGQLGNQLFFFFKDFIHLFMRDRQRERQRQREKKAPCGAGSPRQFDFKDRS